MPDSNPKADASARRTSNSSADANALVPVNSAVLDLNLRPGVDAYLPSQTTIVPERVFSRKQRPNRQLIDRIEKQGISKVLIASKDQELFNQYLSSNWESLLSKDDVPFEQRFAILCEVVRSKLDQEFRKPTIEPTPLVDTSCMLAAEVCALMAEQPLEIETVRLVLNHDASLATHATKCGVLACLLGRALKYRGEPLQDLVHGAMLQDVGMNLVPSKHWQKKSKLRVDDLREIRRHPMLGFELLLNEKMISSRALLMIYQHHEREDGSGFPVSVDRKEIHPFAQIGAVIDVFSAMTSRRSHRLPWSWAEAADIMTESISKRFNEEALQCWLRIVDS